MIMQKIVNMAFSNHWRDIFDMACLLTMDSVWPSSPSAVVSEAGGSVRPGDSWSTTSNNRSRKRFDVMFYIRFIFLALRTDALEMWILLATSSDAQYWCVTWLLLGEPCSSFQTNKKNTKLGSLTTSAPAMAATVTVLHQLCHWCCRLRSLPWKRRELTPAGWCRAWGVLEWSRAGGHPYHNSRPSSSK